MRRDVPPNIMIVYEKGDAIANRAYSTTYDPVSLTISLFSVE